MDHIAKQDRSRKRIEIILETAEKILLEDGIDQVTIANISNRSGLKELQPINFFKLLKQSNQCSFRITLICVR